MYGVDRQNQRDEHHVLYTYSSNRTDSHSPLKIFHVWLDNRPGSAEIIRDVQIVGGATRHWWPTKRYHHWVSLRMEGDLTGVKTNRHRCECLKVTSRDNDLVCGIGENVAFLEKVKKSICWLFTYKMWILADNYIKLHIYFYM